MSLESSELIHQKIDFPPLNGHASGENVNKYIHQWSSSNHESSPYTSPEFEINTPETEEIRNQVIPYLVGLPDNKGAEMWRNGSRITGRITENAASHKALLDVYRGPSQEEETEKEFEFADFMLQVLDSPKEARNRYRIVQNTLSEELNRRDGEISILSLAGGSSKAILEGVSSLPTAKKEKINIRLVDLSEEALVDGQELAESLKLSGQLETRLANFIRFDKYLEEGYNPNFVEIVGLFDYLQDKHIIKLLSKVYEKLTEDGSVIFSNVAENDERDFLHNVAGWEEMVYRDEEHLRHLAISAGFDPDKIQLKKTPKGHTNLIVARK